MLCLLAVCLILATVTTTGGQEPSDISDWTIYITNDNCPDYTWGLTEKQESEEDRSIKIPVFVQIFEKAALKQKNLDSSSSIL